MGKYYNAVLTPLAWVAFFGSVALVVVGFPLMILLGFLGVIH